MNILGTRPEDIDRAEDRDKFSAMLDSIGVDQVSYLSYLEVHRSHRTIIDRPHRRLSCWMAICMARCWMAHSKYFKKDRLPQVWRRKRAPHAPRTVNIETGRAVACGGNGRLLVRREYDCVPKRGLGDVAVGQLIFSDALVWMFALLFVAVCHCQLWLSISHRFWG